MRCIYLKAREYRECFKGRLLSLAFYMEVIYLCVLKTLVHRFELIYIPDLTRLENDVETKPGPNVDSATTVFLPLR